MFYLTEKLMKLKRRNYNIQSYWLEAGTIPLFFLTYQFKDNLRASEMGWKCLYTFAVTLPFSMLYWLIHPAS